MKIKTRPVVVGLMTVLLTLGTSAASADTNLRIEGAAALLSVHRLVRHSEVLDEDRELLIWLPQDYDSSEQPLPVIYLLDGRSNFRHTVSTVELLTVNDRMPRSMVVGICNTDRGRDFTAVEDPSRPSGGADRFLSFFTAELIPLVDNNFRTAPHRTLIGHSLGGLFALHAVVERPDLFDAVIAISPAVSNDERVGDGAQPISERLATTLQTAESYPESLYITMSDGEDPRWTSDLQAVLAVLEEHLPVGLRWTFRQMEGEDHGTTVLPSTFYGLRFVNAVWDTSDIMAHGTVEDLVDRFRMLSERLAFELQPPETMVNLLGYRLLRDGRIDAAIDAFRVNASLYPDSANVHDSLGEALERRGRLPGALRCYRRAVRRAGSSHDRRLPVFADNLRRVTALLETASEKAPGGPASARGELPLQ